MIHHVTTRRGRAATAGPPAADQLPPGAKRSLAALVLGGAAAILDSTIVTIALDKLATDLHASTVTIQWVMTAYLLALVIAIPLSGWAQARFGGKRAWIAALLIFGVFSVGCAASWNVGSLIVFRILQGFGAGLIAPLMQTMAMQSVGTVTSKVMGKAVATISVPMALGPILGPVLGGVILHWLDWRWMFLVNVPLIAVGVILAQRLLPTSPPKSERAHAKLDVVGLALLGPALAAILLGLARMGAHGTIASPDAIIPLAAGLALAATFTGWALKRKAAAVVDISLLRIRSLGTASIVLFAAGVALYAAMVLLPLYWQQVRGASVLTAALFLIPQGVGALASRLVAARLSSRLGVRILTITAFAVTAIATVPFALADSTTSEWWLGAVLLVRGFGVGVVIMAPIMGAYAEVTRPQMPHATMATRITQQVGASFGAATAAVALAIFATRGGLAAFHGAFWWTTGITVVALIPALAFRRDTLKEGTSTKG